MTVTHTLVFSETDSIKISSQNDFLSLHSVGEIVLLIPPVLLKMGRSTVCSISCVKVGANRPVQQAPCCLGPWVVLHVCGLCFSLILYITSVFKDFFVHMYRCKAVSMGKNSVSNIVFQSNGADQFGIDNKNLFQEENSPAGSDVPPALPPKTGTPTRPPPPPPGQ